MNTLNAAQSQFRAALVAAYAHLFATDPAYAHSASKQTPEGLADIMTAAAIRGTANTTGPGFRMACKTCGIKHTGRSIAAFLDPLRNASDVPAVCHK